MGTVVYPDPRVDRHLSGHFTGFRLSLLEKHPDFKEATLGRPVGWAPTFLFSDGAREVRRSVGWLGVDDFLAELDLARAQHHLLRGRLDDALGILETVAESRTQAAPEAGYFAGVAIFLEGRRDMAGLKERWNRLRAAHPASDWARKAEVVDDLP
jgi:hypothetical protein